MVTGSGGPTAASHDEAVGFTLRLAEALHRYGAPAHRLEAVTTGMAERLGLQGQFFSMPTAFFAAFGPWEQQRSYLVRVEPGDVDLDKQLRLDAVAEAVAAGRMTPLEGDRAIEGIEAAPPRYGAALTLAAHGLAAAVAARFFGGGLAEVVTAGVVGLLVGLAALLLPRIEGASRVFEPVAAVGASLLVALASVIWGGLSTPITVLGGVIVLVPGLTLTVAMNELATRHLMSGTGRLMGAATTFLVIGLGVALGGKLAAWMPGGVGSLPPTPLPGYTEAIALVIGLLAFAVFFRAPERDLPIILAVGGAAYATARLGAETLGANLAVGAAALLLGCASNAYARVTRRPASLPLTPGLMLLVPGSVGMRSLFSLMDRNVLSGVETAFQMGMAAASLVTGLLLANVLLPPRRPL
jgi:uncharacterized membrane protein YjjP (DUF1212 family)